MMARHYIRVDNNTVIKYFSDDFEIPAADDIGVLDNAPRQIPDQYRMLVNNDGLYIYKWTGKKIVEKTYSEIYTADVKIQLANAEMIKQINAFCDIIKNNLGDILFLLISKGIITKDELPQDVQGALTGIQTARDNIKIPIDPQPVPIVILPKG
jgi:hypothetical protein